MYDRNEKGRKRKGKRRGEVFRGIIVYIFVIKRVISIVNCKLKLCAGFREEVYPSVEERPFGEE